MGDTEVCRTMRIVFNAVEQVRDAYRLETGPNPARKQSEAGTLNAFLERSGQLLWDAQGLLVRDEVERYTKRLKELGLQLRTQAKSIQKLSIPQKRPPAGALSLAHHRDLIEGLTDASDALTAFAAITQLGVESGLAG